jgi:hypothetical protein
MYAFQVGEGRTQKIEKGEMLFVKGAPGCRDTNHKCNSR